LTDQAEALCHGAATIINAIADGKGAAFGIDLWTKAKVKLTDESGIVEGRIVSDPAENSVLIKKTVERVFRYFDISNRFGARVETSSSIPIAKGLKSSSAAANAVALATVAALNKSLDDLAIVNLGVDGALDANVTITGAFDDASASYFGGVIIADNVKRRILKRLVVSEDLAVLLHVPANKSYTINTDVGRVQSVASLTRIAFKEASHGNYWSALSLNGLIYSAALGYDPSVALDALMAGAVAAGLSGKGPAVSAVVPNEKVDKVKTIWQAYEGEILQVRLNNKKATAVG
jgi:shikimate kinase